ncbi:hypothetical protein FGO68_gene7655 [Halteria grandinella]|uniref:Pseudouridine synthase RsuA/RluA-like domain-containing protein n=1 Tax=Halteria grandinella TaxID=5974 RepID=A0A8J8T1Q7_HALGN|nr:hypothetical protein FGO68_gene7655 [Halteria grandinella]
MALRSTLIRDFLKPQHRCFSLKQLNSPRSRIIDVPPTFDGVRFDRFLMEHLKLPWALAHRQIRSKQSFVFHKKDADYEYVYKEQAYKMQKGDKVCMPKDIKTNDSPSENELSVSKLDESIVKGMAERLGDMIVYENEHIIVINKDNGVPSQMGSGLSMDVKGEIAVDKMLEAYMITNGHQGTGKLVHRLDRKTSGLMVLAKTKDMASRLSFLLRDKSNSTEPQIYKGYYALLCGTPKFKEGLLRQSYAEKETVWEVESLDDSRRLRVQSNGMLGRETEPFFDMRASFKVLTTAVVNPEGVISVLNDKETAPHSSEIFTYTRFVIDTGKKHQIRLHAQYALQTPIFADESHGYHTEKHSPILSQQYKTKVDSKKCIMLHAGELEIPLAPGTQQLEKFTGKFKAPMRKLLDHLQIPKGYYI